MAKGKIFLIAPKENPFLFFYTSKKCTCIIRFLNGSNNTLVILLDFLLLISSFGNFFGCQLSWRHCEMMLREMRTPRSYIKTRDHFVQLRKGEVVDVDLCGFLGCFPVSCCTNIPGYLATVKLRTHHNV